MGKVNVIIVDATGNKEQKVGLPDDIKCGIIMVKLVEKIKLPSIGPDGNPISYKFIHKVTGRQLLETLETFVLDAGMSTSKTAQIMDVHTNTVQYRLKKINEILGVEVTGSRTTPGLTMALALKRLERAVS